MNILDLFHIPILWRYLNMRFWKGTLLFISIFIGALLTLELDEIARFMSLGASFNHVLQFTLYQIPYILPIAIPISALISSFYLIHSLSKHQELTALRSFGFSLPSLFFPLLLSSLFLSCFNFLIVSEISTHAHFATSKLKKELRSLNPLFVLNNKHFMRVQGSYFEVQGSSKAGEIAEEVLLLFPSKDTARLGAMTASSLKVNKGFLEGTKETHLIPLKEESPFFDPFLLETVEKTKTPVQDFGEILQQNAWKIQNDYLSLEQLLGDLKTKKALLKKEKLTPEETSDVSFSINTIYSELGRRFSLAWLPFTFTLLGLSFGVGVGRDLKTPLGFVLSLSGLYLILFFAAKSLHKDPLFSLSLYFFPHLLIFVAAALRIYSIQNTKKRRVS